MITGNITLADKDDELIAEGVVDNEVRKAAAARDELDFEAAANRDELGLEEASTRDELGLKKQPPEMSEE